MASGGRTDPSRPPSPWAVRFRPLVAEGGAVLDLACGAGRHTRLFRQFGHPVVALDVDISGVADLAGDDRVEAIEADLEGGAAWPLGGRLFSAVVVTNYLHRPLFPHIVAALEDGGVLIYETFAIGNEAFSRPRNPDFLLAPGELLQLVEDRLQVVAFEQGVVTRRRSAVVQRICAINQAAPVSLE